MSTEETGWLSGLTNWLKEALASYWDAICAFAHDAGIWVFSTVCDIAVTVANAIPVPDFLTEYSIGALLASAGSTVLWGCGVLKIGECFVVFGLGVVANLVRKLFTLGQW